MRRLHVAAFTLAAALASSGAGAQFRAGDDRSAYSGWFGGGMMYDICRHHYRRQMETEAVAAGAAAELEDAKRKALLPHYDPGAVDLCPKPRRMTDDGCQ
jgi:hypothetical protein